MNQNVLVFLLFFEGHQNRTGYLPQTAEACHPPILDMAFKGIKSVR